jgi:hypothetical protein
MLRTRTLGRVLASAALAVVLAALPALPGAGPAAAKADGIRDSQDWVFDMLHVWDAWNVTEGSGVTVAVIDSGVYGSVSDLSGGTVIQGPDLTGLKTPSSNANWGDHGTWMASIIAGHGHDDGLDGIRGIAPEAKILSIRVIPDKGDPNYQKYNNEPEQTIQNELATGIRTAVKDGAKVISMSIGYSAPSGVVRDAIDYAYAHGVVLVASSGNSGDNDTQHGTSNPDIAPVSFPAEYPGVLSVGAVTIGGVPAKFSSGNLSVRVAAPGKKVPAQGRNGEDYVVDGTSPACAIVAGAAALLKAKYPKITPAQVAEALTTTAQQSSTDNYSVLTGFGIVDADAALLKAGQMMRTKAQSQVSTTAHFGGGPAAVAAAPVTARGTGWYKAFVVLMIVAGLVVLAGGVGLFLTQGARRS